MSCLARSIGAGRLPERARWWRSGRRLALVHALLAVAPVGASVFDWATGSHEPATGLVAETGYERLPQFASVLHRPPAPGGRVSWQNDLPVDWTRAGATSARLRTFDQLWRVTGEVGSGWYRLEARQVRSAYEWNLDRDANQLGWREHRYAARFEQALGERWRLATGYEESQSAMDLTIGQDTVRPSSEGWFDAPLDERVWWTGVATRLGSVEVAVNGAWSWHDAGIVTGIRGLTAEAPFRLHGWQAAGEVTIPCGDDWAVAVAGSWRTMRDKEDVLVEGVRHGRSWPELDEWRWSVEAAGRPATAVRWWGSLFGRRVTARLPANATALPPPLGALVGPRFRLEAHLDAYQTGLATGLEWRPDRRTTWSVACRASAGAARGWYVVGEKLGQADFQEASSAELDQGVWLLVGSLGVQRWVGSLLIGARLNAPVPLTWNRLPDSLSPPSGEQTKAGLPWTVSLEVPW